VDTSRIPVLPVVSRFSKAFQFDPLKMISQEPWLATIPPEQVKAARRSLDDKGIAFADIGQIIEGKGVQIVQDGHFTLYQGIHCEEDELARSGKCILRLLFQRKIEIPMYSSLCN
jgi:hydrogenase maturation factor